MRRANRAVRPTCGSEYEAVPLETIAVEVGDERKVRKEGRRLACANRGASFRAACCAPRLHLPKIHHLRVSPSPPSSPAPFYLLLPSCAFPSTFSLRVTLLSHLSRHSTADKSLLTGDYSSPSREAERRMFCCTGDWDTVRASLVVYQVLTKNATRRIFGNFKSPEVSLPC